MFNYYTFDLDLFGFIYTLSLCAVNKIIITCAF